MRIATPQAAVKWMWNHEQGPRYTDNVGVGWNVELVNAKGEREGLLASDFWRRMTWRGRLSIDPKPVVAHDPAIGYSELWGPLHEPNDLSGAAILNFRYVSPDLPDDSYKYLPTRFDQYAFAKRILYIDKESLMAQFNEGYDHGGQLWKAWYMRRGNEAPRNREADGWIDRGGPDEDDESPDVRRRAPLPCPRRRRRRAVRARVEVRRAGCVRLSQSRAKHWYHDVPRDWNTPDQFTLNHLIKRAGF